MIEDVVRPFETPLVIATQRVVVQPTIAKPELATIKWGAAGTIPNPIQVVAPQNFGFKTVDCDALNTELSRETVDVKVTNPQDPSQYVIVQRIQKIKFQHPNKNQDTFWDQVVGVGEWSGDVGSTNQQEQCQQEYDLFWGTS